MADIIDKASDAANEFIEDALLAHRHSKASRTMITNSKYCEACGEPIPLERQLAVQGVRLCIVCQKELENGHC